MSTNDRVLGLVERALVDFDASSTSGLVRQVLRIAVLLDDAAAVIWLEREATEIPQADMTPDALGKKMSARIKDEFPDLPQERAFRIVMTDFAAYWERRTSQNGSIVVKSIADLEQHIELVQGAADDISRQALASSDGKSLTGVLEAKIALNQYRNILTKTRGAIFDYLVAVEKRLAVTGSAVGVFDRLRDGATSALALISSDTVEQFAAAQERLSRGDAESLSHALLSCRRMLKSTADALYPPSNDEVTGLDGRVRKLTDDRYINRLLQYVAESVGKHGSGEVLQGILQSLGAQLSALDGLASKGVHAQVTVDEVEFCVVQTFLVIGEVMRIAGRGA